MLPGLRFRVFAPPPEAPLAARGIDRIPWVSFFQKIPFLEGNRAKPSVRMKNNASLLEANRAKPSVRMKKQVPKNGIIDATVDSERG